MKSHQDSAQRPASGPLPLEGITVIDLTTVVFGPYGTQIFADLGATVIKIEGPDGDSSRLIGPAREPGMGGSYMYLNRGKKGVLLDLKLPKAREAVLRMCEGADVFVHSMRPQAIERLGLDYATVSARNPSIIYCNCWGFGRDGPYAEKAAYDDIIQASSGLVSLIEETTGEAAYVPTVIADKVAGLTLAYATLAALLQRSRTGAGAELEVPMFETMSAFMLIEHASGAMFDPPLGRPVYGRQTARTRRPFPTRDGRISVIVYNDKQWEKFGQLVGKPNLLEDPAFNCMASRLANIDLVNGFLAEQFRRKTTAEWQVLLDAAGIPTMPVNSTEDLYHDAHLRKVGFFQISEDAELGRMCYPRHPVRFDGVMPSVRGRAPRLGEHTREILAQAGLTPAEIDALAVPSKLDTSAPNGDA